MVTSRRRALLGSLVESALARQRTAVKHTALNVALQTAVSQAQFPDPSRGRGRTVRALPVPSRFHRARSRTNELPIGTDAKHVAHLGIRCYGFIPMQPPVAFDFPAVFHGADADQTGSSQMRV